MFFYAETSEKSPLQHICLCTVANYRFPFPFAYWFPSNLSLGPHSYRWEQYGIQNSMCFCLHLLIWVLDWKDRTEWDRSEPGTTGTDNVLDPYSPGSYTVQARTQLSRFALQQPPQHVILVIVTPSLQSPDPPGTWLTALNVCASFTAGTKCISPLLSNTEGKQEQHWH